MPCLAASTDFVLGVIKMFGNWILGEVAQCHEDTIAFSFVAFKIVDLLPEFHLKHKTKAFL